MADGKKAVALVIGVFLVALLAAFLMPVALDAIAGDETSTITQNVSDTDTVQPDLNVTLDSVDTSGDNATYTVNASGDTATTTVDNGTNETVTVDGIDVTIAVTDVQTGQATADVSYPTDYGWGSGASAMWAILPVIIVLAIFLYIVGLALANDYF